VVNILPVHTVETYGGGIRTKAPFILNIKIRPKQVVSYMPRPVTSFEIILCTRHLNDVRNSLCILHLALFAGQKQMECCCLGKEWLCAVAVVGNTKVKLLWQYVA
jgi:hypothetical protein